MSSTPGSSAERPSAVGRRCTRSSCQSNAIATLTYIYAESTAVLAPLSTYVEPHSYDLCEAHSEKLTVPKGWTVIQHNPKINLSAQSPADVLAIAEAIRKSAKMELPQKNMAPEVGRRGHLRALPNQDS